METVGVGQSELDIVSAAETTIVVLVPESGDGVQTMKAGLMEIADIFVINKADREGADGLAREIEAVLSMREAADGWGIPVLLTTAIRAEGIEELVEAVERHRKFLTSSKLLEAKRRERVRKRIRDLIAMRIEYIVRENKEVQALINSYLESNQGAETPYTLADEVVKKLGMT
jgi:LAO/AO transport system kinase